MAKAFLKLSLVFLFVTLVPGCHQRTNDIEVRNLNSYIVDYFDTKADTLDYSKFNLEANGVHRIIAIDPRINSLEFILIDSAENNVSYYKNGMEKQYYLTTNRQK